MILYNSIWAKAFLNKKKYYFMLFGCCFTRYKYLEAWEDMELRIHERQYLECFLLAFVNYHLLYWIERWFGHHSSFDWEALEHCGDSLYLRKRNAYAWMKWYGRKVLPPSEWDDD